MKLSKDYIIERLKTTTVDDLAQEIAQDMADNNPGAAIDMAATVTKFTAMIKPYAPKTMKATDLMRANGVTVIEVK